VVYQKPRKQLTFLNIIWTLKTTAYGDFKNSCMTNFFFDYFFNYVCLFWQNFAPVDICHALGGGMSPCRPFSPDTVTARRKMPPVAEFEPAAVRVVTDALVRSAIPSPIKHLFGSYFIISSSYKYKLHKTQVLCINEIFDLL